MPEPQNYANHVKRLPAADYLIVLPLLANLVLTLYRVSQGVTLDRAVNLAMAVAFIALLFSLRRQVVTVQDRVIRNEMRERLRTLLPSELAGRACALPPRQLAALRFAGDAELPDLVREVIEGRLTSSKEIKMRVRDWQGDFLRC